MSTVPGGLVHRAMTGVGRLCVKRPWWIIAGWVVLTAVVVTLLASYGGPTEDDVSLPGSDAQLGRELLDAHFPGSSNATGQIVLRADSGRLDDATNRTAIADAVTRVGELPAVTEVTAPAAEAGTLSLDPWTDWGSWPVRT